MDAFMVGYIVFWLTLLSYLAGVSMVDWFYSKYLRAIESYHNIYIPRP